MSQDYDSREEICPDCHATESNRDARIIGAGEDPKTGRMFTTTTYHHDDCPAYTIYRIRMEDGVRRAKEESEWGRREFPAAHERLRRAVMSVKADEVAQPFVGALVELVEAQGENLGRVVLPHRWAEILNKHFPADPVRPDEEPT